VKFNDYSCDLRNLPDQLQRGIQEFLRYACLGSLMMNDKINNSSGLGAVLGQNNEDCSLQGHSYFVHDVIPYETKTTPALFQEEPQGPEKAFFTPHGPLYGLQRFK
jgi:hypothetical protein